MILPILSAALGIIAFLPFKYLYIFGFLFLVPFFVFLVRENRFWRLVLGAFIFIIIFSLGTVYFTLEPITWLASALIFLGLPISIFSVKKFLKPINNYRLLIALPLLWTIFTHLQAQYSPLPIYIIAAGNIFGSSPFLGMANFGGLLGLTFFAAALNALTAILVLKIKTLNSKFYILNSLIIAALIIAGWQISQFQLRKNSLIYNNFKNPIEITAVSVNKNFSEQDLQKVKNELSDKNADLIIFPEDILNYSNPNNQMTLLMSDLAKELKKNLIAVFDTYQNGKKYNSAVLFNEKGEIIDIYNKNRLTFIGEYWPFKNWRPFFFDLALKTNPEFRNFAVFSNQNYQKGGEKRLFEINRAKFAAPICLEIHYPYDLKKFKEMGARFIVNQSSNRWLDIGTKHYLYLINNLRRVEAVWLKIPIVSSGVNDYAGIITPDGEADLVNYESGNKNFNIKHFKLSI
jgi:apolipoprotein N-acyltransferase